MKLCTSGEPAVAEVNFEEQPGFSYRNEFVRLIRGRGRLESYGSLTQDGSYEWFLSIYDQRRRRRLMHELTGKELDNIGKVISNVNVGQFTDLIGQSPPADFDLENYEDHLPEAHNAIVPEQHPNYTEFEVESGDDTSGTTAARRQHGPLSRSLGTTASSWTNTRPARRSGGTTEVEISAMGDS